MSLEAVEKLVTEWRRRVELTQSTNELQAYTIRRATEQHIAELEAALRAAPSLHKEGAGGATDNEIFLLACKLVDTASSDRKTYWLPVLSQLCEAVRKQDAEIASLRASPAGRAEQPEGK